MHWANIFLELGFNTCLVEDNKRTDLFKLVFLIIKKNPLNPSNQFYLCSILLSILPRAGWDILSLTTILLPPAHAMQAALIILSIPYLDLYRSRLKPIAHLKAHI